MRLFAVLLLAAWTLVPVSGLALSLSLRTIAADGDPVVGGTGTFRFSPLNWRASMSEDGSIAVVASTTVEEGVWVFDPSGTATPIAIAGDAVPGQPGATFYTFDRASGVAEGGAFAFYGTFMPAGSTVGTTGLWRVENGATASPVFHEGDPAPGTTAAFFTGNQRFWDSDAEGRVVFREKLTGNLVDRTNEVGIWLRRSDGTVVLLARDGNPATGISASPILGVGVPEMNARGESIFGLVTPQESGTVRASVDGQLSWVVRDGDVAVGTGGVRFDRTLARVIGDSGSVVYSAVLDPATAAPNADRGTWIFDRSGASRLVVREGDAVPSAAGLTIAGRLGKVAINESDQLVGVTSLAGPSVTALNDLAIFGADPSGDITLFVREGELIPGSASISFVNFFFDLHINARGDMAFGAEVFDSTTNEISEAIFFRSWDGVLLTVAKSGDLIEIRPGDFGTIGLMGEQPVALRGLTDDRQILFGAAFGPTRSALLVARVPEPSIVLLVSISAVMATRTATRRRRN